MAQLSRPATTNAATIHQSKPRSCLRMPSSTAYLARKGGASAVAVAASSETMESAVRTLYGFVSRASSAMRLRVRRQDQSSTSTFLIELRWAPGCQTLTGGDLFQVRARATPPGRGKTPPATRGRRYPKKSHTFVPIVDRKSASGCGLQGGGSGARFHCVRELPLEQAVVVDVAVHLARREQFLVCSAGCDAPVVEHDDLVCQRDRRETVGDDQGCPVSHRLAQADADSRFGGGVH